MCACLLLSFSNFIIFHYFFYWRCFMINLVDLKVSLIIWMCYDFCNEYKFFIFPFCKCSALWSFMAAMVIGWIFSINILCTKLNFIKFYLLDSWLIITKFWYLYWVNFIYISNFCLPDILVKLIWFVSDISRCHIRFYFIGSVANLSNI